jgi:hypothetical protein
MPYLSIKNGAIELKNGVFNYGANWLHGDYSQDYINEVLKCIEFCKPEIYFHNIFSNLNKQGNFDESGFVNVSMSNYRIFEKFCNSLFVLKCDKNIDGFEENDIVESVNENNIIVKHFDAYYDTIELYVNYYSNISTLGFSKNENIFGDYRTIEFFINVMLISYYVTSIRIRENISNSDLFSIDHIWHPTGNLLTLYFTPFALLNREFVRKTYISKPKDCLEIFFKSLGIIKVSGKSNKDDKNVQLEVFYSGRSYIIEFPNEHPFFYLNEFLENILSDKYLNLLSQNKLLSFKAR